MGGGWGVHGLGSNIVALLSQAYSLVAGSLFFKNVCMYVCICNFFTNVGIELITIRSRVPQSSD